MMTKSTLLTFSFALLSWAVFAQVSLNTTDTTYVAVPDGFTDITGYGLVTNEANADKTYEWTRNIVFMTNGWETAVCDKEQCYAPFVDSQQFEMFPLESDTTMDVHVYPSGIPGSAFIEITVTDIDDSNNSAIGFYSFDSNFTGTQNVSQSFFKVYPNPSSGLFTIEGDVAIEEVVIYNTAGQLLKRFQYSSTEWYSINELSKGTYMLHLIGKDKETLSSKLITKL